MKNEFLSKLFVYGSDNDFFTYYKLLKIYIKHMLVWHIGIDDNSKFENVYNDVLIFTGADYGDYFHCKDNITEYFLCFQIFQ